MSVMHASDPSTQSSPVLVIPGLAGSCAGLLAAADELFPAFTRIPFDHQTGVPVPGFEQLAELASAALLAGFDARPWLNEVRCPSLVIVARRDPVVPPSAGRELGRLLPGAQTCELPCGHLSYLAMPEAIRGLVESWHESHEAHRNQTG